MEGQRPARDESQLLKESNSTGLAPATIFGEGADEATGVTGGRNTEIRPGTEEERAAGEMVTRRRQQEGKLGNQVDKQNITEGVAETGAESCLEKQPGCRPGDDNGENELELNSTKDGEHVQNRAQVELERRKPQAETLPTSGTSGVDKGSEDIPGLETSIQWSLIKRAGKKRTLEAIESSPYANGEEEEGEEDQTSGGGEEVEEEPEAGRGKEVGREGNRMGSEESPDQVQSEEGGEERTLGDLLRGTVEGRGPEPTVNRDPKRRPGPACRKEGALGPSRLKVRKGLGKTQKIRRGRVKINVSSPKEVTSVEKYRRERKSQEPFVQEFTQDDIVMEVVRGTTLGAEVSTTSRQVHIEVILETQPLPLNGKGTKYKDILASIG